MSEFRQETLKYPELERRKQRFNLNDEVWIKITPIGEQIIADFEKNHGWKPYRGSQLEDGYTSMQLWQVFDLFGSHIPGEIRGLGAKGPIENNFYIPEDTWEYQDRINGVTTEATNPDVDYP